MKANIFNIADAGIIFRDVKGNKNTETTVTHFYIDDGKVNALGKRIIKNRVFDSLNDPTTKFDEEVKPVAITDTTQLNRIATLIKNEEGSNLKNLKELKVLLQNILNPTTPTTKKFDPKNF